MDAEKAREDFLNEIRPVPYLEYTEYNFEKRLEGLMIIARAICPKFELSDDQTRDLYHETIRYFAADKACKFDLTKGLYVYGKIGAGKTLYFKIFSEQNRALRSRNGFRTLTVNQLIDGISDQGNKYFIESRITPGVLLPMINTYFHRCGHIFIDDLGQSARIANYFGNSINVVESFLQRRYYAYTEYFLLTHVSTNVLPTEMTSEYGPFIASRMREMFNVILFPGEDKRK